ncbi:hypothetical protein [Streptacidiphilus sp. MAP5-3]|uniref:hypothetical protein n=1 Tax=unclassified Streptacidiphilus TaxID=2643834 RepID=UPI003519D0FD
MTTRGESTADPREPEPQPADAPVHAPAHAPAHAAGHRPRRGSRRAALIGLLVVSAGIATWAEVHYTGASSAAAGTGSTEISQDSVGGVAVPGDTSGAAAAQGDLPDASTIAPATVNVPESATNVNAYQETRYALDSAASCLGVMAPTVPNAVVTSCEGYLTADYLSADHSVLSQVTLFTFADAETARQAESALDSASSVSMRQPGNAVPGVTAPTTAAQWKVAQVGRFVTVVHSAYAAQTTGATADLVTPTWYLTAQTGDAVMWDD